MLRRPETSDFKKQRKVGMKRTLRTLLTPEQMNQAMARESSRVDRKGAGALSLVLFRLPGAGERSKLSGVRLARTILKRIRVTDDLGWFDEDHLGLLLPDTPPTGAWRLAMEVCEAVAPRGGRPLCTMYTYPAESGEESEGVVRTSEALPAAGTVTAKVAS